MNTIFFISCLLIFGVFGLDMNHFYNEKVYQENVNHLEAEIDNIHHSQTAKQLDIELFTTELNKMKNIYNDLFSKSQELMVFLQSLSNNQQCMDRMINIQNLSPTTKVRQSVKKSSAYLNQLVFVDNVNNLFAVIETVNNLNDEQIENCLVSKTKIKLFTKCMDEMIVKYYDLFEKDKELDELMSTYKSDVDSDNIGNQRRRLGSYPYYASDAECEQKCNYIYIRSATVPCYSKTEVHTECSGVWPFNRECKAVSTPMGYYPRNMNLVVCSTGNNAFARFDSKVQCEANCQWLTPTNKCNAVTRERCTGIWVTRECETVTIGYQAIMASNIDCVR